MFSVPQKVVELSIPFSFSEAPFLPFFLPSQVPVGEFLAWNHPQGPKLTDVRSLT